VHFVSILNAINVISISSQNRHLQFKVVCLSSEIGVKFASGHCVAKVARCALVVPDGNREGGMLQRRQEVVINDREAFPAEDL
jgi:DNA mismatch repair protein MutH